MIIIWIRPFRRHLCFRDLITLYGILSIYFASGAPGPQPIGGHDERYVALINGNVMGVPNLVIIAALTSFVVWVLWNKTTFGKNMYAVGGNPEAARIGSANNGTGYGYELDAIAACVVGGISFNGGVGKVSGAIVGVLIVVAVSLDTKKYLKKSDLFSPFQFG
ncbi:MAG: hypothetical protein B6241_08780 [Spirochaetaceae bacterium 4572_59]|nr:MAG: hypothetical protein B6241_08780 [Spirochaetaceae bacterium 4572_59]